MFFQVPDLYYEKAHLDYGQTSANNVKNSVALGRSFINKINSKGPKMDPCGTPHTFFSVSELTPVTETYCFLSKR